MSRLRAIQEQFLDYLLVGDIRIADEIVDQPPGRDIRLAIYGNAYRLRLVETLETDHEMLGLYLGDELWAQMANAYIDSHPSRFRSLRQFADALPHWLRLAPPFQEHPVIAGIADFERRLLDSFDAAESARASPDQLGALAASNWPGLQLRFHPSMQIFRTDTNCVEIWQALKAKTQPPAASATDAEWLLWRGVDRLTQFRFLPADESLFLQHFLKGGDFAGACEELLSVHAETDVPQIALSHLHGWLEHGLVRDLTAGA